MAVTDQELIRALQRIASVGDQSLRCLGCGHEHNCSIHGCQIIKAASERLQQLLRPEKSASLMFAELGYHPTEYDGNGVEYRKGECTILVHRAGICKTCETAYGRGSDILTPTEALAVAQEIKELEGTQCSI